MLFIHGLPIQDALGRPVVHLDGSELMKAYCDLTLSNEVA